MLALIIINIKFNIILIILIITLLILSINQFNKIKLYKTCESWRSELKYFPCFVLMAPLQWEKVNPKVSTHYRSGKLKGCVKIFPDYQKMPRNRNTFVFLRFIYWRMILSKFIYYRDRNAFNKCIFIFYESDIIIAQTLHHIKNVIYI